jgi:hypothetical protein
MVNMKLLTIDKIEHHIPTDWNDITLAKQVELELLIQQNKTVDEPELESLIMLSVYFDIPLSSIRSLHLNIVKDLLNDLNQLINIPLPSTPLAEFEYKGDKYTVINTLMNAPFGDFISLEEISKQFEKQPAKSLPYIVAVLAKKIVNGKPEILDDIDIEERVKHFNELPFPIANQMQVFFWQVANLYSIDSLSLLKNQNQIIQELNNSIQDTPLVQGGTGLFGRWVKKQFKGYSMSLVKNWNKYYSGHILEMKNSN